MQQIKKTYNKMSDKTDWRSIIITLNVILCQYLSIVLTRLNVKSIDILLCYANKQI